MPRGSSRSVRRYWIALALVLAAAIAWFALAERSAEAPAATAAKPALWRIADGDTTIYLFGTIHALPREIAWRTPPIERAIEASDALILEIADGDAVDEISLFSAMATDNAPREAIAARIDRDLATALDKAIFRTDLSRAQLNAMEDWAAALTIGNALGARAGFDTARGVEAVLDARFRSAGKPVSGLETTAGQLGIFDSLPAATQNALLVRAIVGADDGPERMNDLTRAWERGDVATIERLIKRDIGAVAGLADPLIDRRNARWAERLAERLDRPGTVFVAVGAGHLVGPRSVQGRLATRTGLEAERIQ